ncbi:hypothetical protein ACOJBO_25735 [Rhizobium beringeri]
MTFEGEFSGLQFGVQILTGLWAVSGFKNLQGHRPDSSFSAAAAGRRLVLPTLCSTRNSGFSPIRRGNRTRRRDICRAFSNKHSNRLAVGLKIRLLYLQHFDEGFDVAAL